MPFTAAICIAIGATRLRVMATHCVCSWRSTKSGDLRKRALVRPQQSLLHASSKSSLTVVVAYVLQAWWTCVVQTCLCSQGQARKGRRHDVVPQIELSMYSEHQARSAW